MGMSIDPDALASYARAKRALGWVFAVVSLLLATNLGEFWPFSIYPMFSRAGRPFTRSIVRELEPDEQVGRGPFSWNTLPGRPFALVPAGIAQNDVANIVSKTQVWTPKRAQALQRLFGEHAATRRLLVLSAHGWLSDDPMDDGVSLEFRPLAQLSAAGPQLLAGRR
jgi:hypothetical protein